MVTKGDQLFGILGCVTFCIAMAFFLPSFSLPYWTLHSNDTVSTHAGLWLKCANDSAPDDCHSLFATSETPGYLKAVQGLQIITIIGLAIGFVLILITLIVPNMKEMDSDQRMRTIDQATKYFICITLTSAACCLLSLITYGAEHDTSELGYAFFLQIVTLIALVFNAPMAFFNCWIMIVIDEEV